MQSGHLNVNGGRMVAIEIYEDLGKVKIKKRHVSLVGSRLPVDPKLKMQRSSG